MNHATNDAHYLINMSDALHVHMLWILSCTGAITLGPPWSMKGEEKNNTAWARPVMTHPRACSPRPRLVACASVCVVLGHTPCWAACLLAMLTCAHGFRPRSGLWVKLKKLISFFLPLWDGLLSSPLLLFLDFFKGQLRDFFPTTSTQHLIST